MPSNETQSRYEAHDYIEDRRAEEGYGPGEQPILDREVELARRAGVALAALADVIIEAEHARFPNMARESRAIVAEAISEGFRGTFDLPDSFIALVASLARSAQPVTEGNG